jgi:hypothetical protein
MSDLRVSVPSLRVSDGMKGDTPDILYNMCLGLYKLYGEPIHGMDESILKVHALVHRVVEYLSHNCTQSFLRNQ